MTDAQMKDTQQITALFNILSVFLIMQIIGSAKSNYMPFSKAYDVEISEYILHGWKTL